MPTYSPDGQWFWDGQRWLPAQGPLPPDARDQDGKPVTDKSARAARASFAESTPPIRREGYTSFGSRELGETKWFLAGCAWTVYTVGFVLLSFHLWQSAISPPPPPSAFAVQMGVARPENVGADVIFGLLTAVLACLAAIYTYRIWTRRARWIIVIPLIF